VRIIFSRRDGENKLYTPDQLGIQPKQNKKLTIVALAIIAVFVVRLNFNLARKLTGFPKLV
jgi:hypothetical protein